MSGPRIDSSLYRERDLVPIRRSADYLELARSWEL